MSVRGFISQQVEKAWYEGARWSRALAPLEPIYKRSALKVRVRDQIFAKKNPLNIPVVVVGNITAGGTGKSPVVAQLARDFLDRGYRPGILSRGYKAEVNDQPHLVRPTDLASQVGDEPLMLTLSLPDIPVVVDRDRLRGARFLQNESEVNIIICDDGLQHYRLPRDIEILVIDAERGIGNGRLIPVGPLREPVERLASVDYVLCNGQQSTLPEPLINQVDGEFSLQPKCWRKVATGESIDLHAMQAKEVLAISGIGNPKRFHKSLQALGLSPLAVNFPDHHAFQKADFIEAQKRAANKEVQIVMTAKDAVKCRSFADPDWLYLEVEACLPADLLESNLAKLKNRKLRTKSTISSAQHKE